MTKQEFYEAKKIVEDIEQLENFLRAVDGIRPNSKIALRCENSNLIINNPTLRQNITDALKSTISSLYTDLDNFMPERSNTNES